MVSCHVVRTLSVNTLLIARTVEGEKLISTIAAKRKINLSLLMGGNRDLDQSISTLLLPLDMNGVRIGKDGSFSRLRKNVNIFRNL
jgi:hypothetical protein